MTGTVPDLAALPAPESYATLCARFLRAVRALRDWSSGYGDLLPESIFEAVCLMQVHHAPWHSAEQLRVHNRMSVWLMCLDDLAEGAGTSAELDGVLDRCRHVIHGGRPAPGDDFARCLYDIRTQLTTALVWPALSPQWTMLFERTLTAMRTERDMRSAIDCGAAPPTIEDYLANCDNTEVRIAQCTYWIATGEPALLDHIEPLLAALWQAQVAIRWANDFRSVQRRDDESTVVNAGSIGIEPAEIRRRADDAALRCGELLAPLIARSVPEALALDRMTRSVITLYGVSDYRPLAAESPAG